ncbi:MAG: type VI secretion system protein TssA [Bryobacteraceae bacterium]|nr:type VI secretion system protein TssA [Bryobacteraceae bacterium]
MPLRDDLLNPIPGDNPSGKEIRYAPVYDKIKEARREDDDAPQGEWARERKSYDAAQIIKLAGEAIATQSKDLQLAVWMTEALLRKEGVPGLREGLDLNRALIENFWDTLYPEIEDGDIELRAVPLEWLGSRLVDHLKKAPLYKGGVSFYRYQQSRTVPTEAEAGASEQKMEMRQAAVQDGKLTPEEFEQIFRTSSTAQFEAMLATFDGLLESCTALKEICDAKFADYSPSFSPLQTAIEEIRHLIKTQLNRKYELEGGAPEAAVEEAPAGEEYSESYEESSSRPARRKKGISAGPEPTDMEDAAARLAAVARWMRQNDPNSPAPYLMLRGFRWGELRGFGDSPDPTALEAPDSEVRQGLKRLALESNWTELIETAESAMALPCGRAWLDLQRYVVRACDESGYYAISNAIRGEIRCLLLDYPNLPSWTLMDDTPTANGETQAWLQEVAPPVTQEAAAPAQEMFSYSPPPEPSEEHSNGDQSAERMPTAYELALQAAQGGRHREAIEILMDDLGKQQSGRSRFQRKVELAQICIATGHQALAQPILEELAREIDEYRLERWEASPMVAHPLVLLYRCLGTPKAGEEDRKNQLYSRICRLDPLQALAVGR